MNYEIRKMRESEYPLLADFLYQAIYVPQGVTPPPKSIIEKEELQVYIKDFGKEKTDIALVAEVDGKIVGAVWARIMNDYGSIDERTPSLAISLYKEFRGQGIGMTLMQKMLSSLKQSGAKRVSLSVQKSNFAVGLYKKLNFKIFHESAEEYIMVCALQN